MNPAAAPTDPSTPPPPPPGYGPVSVAPASDGAPPPPPPGYGPVSVASATPDPLTHNPNNEGTYEMQGPQGDKVQVPYSNVGTIARDRGYQLTGGLSWYGAPKGEAARYFKDYASDPKVTQGLTQTAHEVQDPGQGLVIGAARGATLTAAGLAHIARKATGTTASTTGVEKDAQAFGEGGDTGAEDAGKFIESAGEFLMGDEALKGLGYLDKLKKVMPTLKVIENSPMLAKIVDTAMSSTAAKVAGTGVRQGIVGGVQGTARSGGNLAAGAEEGIVAGGLGAAVEGTGSYLTNKIADMTPEIKNIGGVDITVPKDSAPPPPGGAQVQGAEAYANEARAAARPHLERVAAGPQEAAPAPAAPAAAAAPGASVDQLASGAPRLGTGDPAGPLLDAGADPQLGPGSSRYTDEGALSVERRLNPQSPAAAAGAAPTPPPKVDIDGMLSQAHDFTGVSNVMTKVNDAAYNTLDKLTGGQFREVNAEVQAARAKDDPDAYRNASAKMEALFDSIDSGASTPSMGRYLSDVKASWRQSYILGDMGKALDRSTNGLPGDTAVSQTQRGINGNKLETQLKNIVRTHGIDNVRATLGPGRLENLQAIAAATRSNAGRRAFNFGIHEIARYVGAGLGVAGARAIGGGENYAIEAGGAMLGSKAAMASMDAIGRVMNAVRTEPKIGQNLIYAIQSGARPENYVPLIAGMIADSQKQHRTKEPTQ